MVRYEDQTDMAAEEDVIAMIMRETPSLTSIANKLTV
jgi:hypothetical protein